MVFLKKITYVWKKKRKKTFLAFKKWVKNIQTAGYNGARTVHENLSQKRSSDSHFEMLGVSKS